MKLSCRMAGDDCNALQLAIASTFIALLKAGLCVHLSILYHSQFALVADVQGIHGDRQGECSPGSFVRFIFKGGCAHADEQPSMDDESIGLDVQTNLRCLCT